MKLRAGPNRDRLFVSACVPLALAVRLLPLTREYVISPDGVMYARLGRQLVSGDLRHGMSAYFPPLYPLLVGLSSLVFRDVEFAGRFVSVAAGGLLVVPVFLLAKSFYDRRVATLAACLVVVFPVLVYYSTQLLTESVYILLFTTGVLLGWRALTRFRASSFFGAGLVFGACYLVKPEAVGFALLLAALAPVAARFRVAKTLRPALPNVAALVAGFLLLASPYVIYLRQQTGRWTISEKLGAHLLVIERAEDWQTPAAQQGSDAATTTPRFVLPEAGDESTLTRFVVKATKALRAEYEMVNLIFPPLFVLLVGVGLFRSSWTRERLARELYLCSFVLATFVGYALTVVDIRYLVPLLPLLVCWLANGVAEFEGWLAETAAQVRGRGRVGRVRPWAVRAALVALSVILLLPLFVYLNWGDKWDDYLGQKRAGQWIKARSAAPPVVMAENPVSAFYAGAQYVALPNADYSEVIDAAKRQGVGYLVIYARYMKNSRLSFLLEGRNVPAEIRQVYQHGGGDFKVVVYQLSQDGAENKQ
jgi:4-amino-4-deoxy-L-arabinose transferase-like glycosyltransferase